MTIQQIKQREEWNSFLLETIKPNTFLQSWEWGQVQKQTGEEVFCLGLFEGDKQVGASLVILVKARRGNFFLIPHGPLFVREDLYEAGLQEIISFCKEKAAEYKAVALRISPLWVSSPGIEKLFSGNGFRPAPLHIHAELTWVLDIQKNEDELLKEMRKTTRHAIKKAEKEGVSVEILTSGKGLERFWPLYTQTTNRHGFVPFGKKFLEQQLAEFSKNNNVFIAIATHKGKDVAGAILMHFSETVFYYHGASVKLPSSVPAAQMLQWGAITEAKKRGATRYNFWGIAPDNEPNHPFAGITVFKKGFGGHAINYHHAQDLPLSFGYWKLWAIDTYRKYKRGF